MGALFSYLIWIFWCGIFNGDSKTIFFFLDHPASIVWFVVICVMNSDNSLTEVCPLKLLLIWKFQINMYSISTVKWYFTVYAAVIVLQTLVPSMGGIRHIVGDKTVSNFKRGGWSASKQYHCFKIVPEMLIF